MDDVYRLLVDYGRGEPYEKKTMLLRLGVPPNINDFRPHIDKEGKFIDDVLDVKPFGDIFSYFNLGINNLFDPIPRLRITKLSSMSCYTEKGDISNPSEFPEKNSGLGEFGLDGLYKDKVGANHPVKLKFQQDNQGRYSVTYRAEKEDGTDMQKMYEEHILRVMKNIFRLMGHNDISLTVVNGKGFSPEQKIIQT